MPHAQLGEDGGIAWATALSAVVGVTGLLVSIYLARRDRGKLEVFAGPDDPARRDVHPPIAGAPRILVHIRNHGRRPVTVERIWYTRRSTKKVPYLISDRYDNGPEVINEGESAVHDLYPWDVTAVDLDRVFVESQDGRVWKGRYRSEPEAPQPRLGSSPATPSP